MTRPDDVQRLRGVIEKIDFCFFSTHDGGSITGRPMSSIFKDDDDRIFFLCDRSSDVATQVKEMSNVALMYTNGSNQFAVIRGAADVSTDQALIKDLWNAGAQAFWPDGPDASKVAALVVTPLDAEHWDGQNAVVTIGKMVTALVTGSRASVGEKVDVAF